MLVIILNFSFKDRFEYPLKAAEDFLPLPRLLGVRDIFDKPVLVLLKNDTEKNEFIAFFIENGLKNIYNNINTRLLHNILNSDIEKRGFLVHPEKISNTPFKDWPISRLILPEGINLAKFNNATKGAYSFSYLIVLKDEDLPRVSLPSLHQLGDFLIDQESVEINHDKLETPNFRFFEKEQPPIPLPVAHIPSFVPPLASDHHHHQPLLSLPLYPADTFPYIPDSRLFSIKEK